MNILSKKEWLTLGIGLVVVALVIIGVYHSKPKTMAVKYIIPPNATLNFDVEVVSIQKAAQNKNKDVAENGDTVVMNYTGTLQDGTKFDASADHGQPFSFVLGAGQVIQGWDEGVLGMKVGEKKHLVIPPEKAYGADGIVDPSSN